MTNLSVNVNKIAWLRNARGENRPNLLETSKVLVDCGVDGLTVHPRPDLRHITPDDVYDLSNLCKNSNIEFNIEGNPLAGPEANGYPGFMSLIDEIRPHQCTLVPDDPLQLTSDHGWDIRQNHNVLAPFIQELAHWSIRSSVFLDADPDQVPAAAQLNIARLELYTGPYAEHFDSPNGPACLDAYVQTAQRTSECGIGINAGHDLNLNNLTMLVKALPQLKEVSIGHALIADALWVGLGKTVQQYCQAIQR